jgi:hypothetical protein
MKKPRRRPRTVRIVIRGVIHTVPPSIARELQATEQLFTRQDWAHNRLP